LVGLVQLRFFRDQFAPLDRLVTMLSCLGYVEKRSLALGQPGDWFPQSGNGIEGWLRRLEHDLDAILSDAECCYDAAARCREISAQRTPACCWRRQARAMARCNGSGRGGIARAK